MNNYLDIWKIHSKKDILNWFNLLKTNLTMNNNAFFHYSCEDLQKYIKNPDLDLEQRFNLFLLYWNNFNNQKRIIQRHFKYNKQNYPNIFQKQQRHIIHSFTIDINFILTEINTLKLNKQYIPYSYIILIEQLTRKIVLEKLFPDKLKKEIIFTKLNVIENDLIIEIEQSDKTFKTYSYKLFKFLQKWQSKYPQLYGIIKAHLVISSNWQDILLQSSFKQWTSCLNLTNIYSDNKIKYTCVNSVKAENLVAYCILDLNDNKTIDEIMDDNGYHRIML